MASVRLETMYFGKYHPHKPIRTQMNVERITLRSCKLSFAGTMISFSFKVLLLFIDPVEIVRDGIARSFSVSDSEKSSILATAQTEISFKR